MDTNDSQCFSLYINYATQVSSILGIFWGGGGEIE